MPVNYVVIVKTILKEYEDLNLKAASTKDLLAEKLLDALAAGAALDVEEQAKAKY